MRCAIQQTGKQLLLAMLACVLLSGCAIRKSHAEVLPPKVPSYALEQDFDTSIGQRLVEGMADHPSQSAFRLITHGSEAFFGRVAMIRAAERSLDFQYYIVEDDLTGSMLLEEILRAADRGVRVRLLVDSMAVSKVSNEVSLMVHHPHIAIRVFNPVALKRDTVLGTVYNWMFDFDRSNSRMHNKALIADNLAAIIGGRNLGDQYFDASGDFTFSDMDVMAAGPIVKQISRSFDHYWNSDQTTLLRDVEHIINDAETLQSIRTDLHQRWQEATDSEAGQKATRAMRLWKAQGKGAFPFIWATADLAFDNPEKVNSDEDGGDAATTTAEKTATILAANAAEPDALPTPVKPEAGTDMETDKENSKPLTRLDQLASQATQSFTIINAYVVPRESGVEWLGELEARGVETRILTNSLASTDVAAVHSGYSRYRPALLHKGVELYEAKSIGDKRSRQNLFGSTPRSSLHAKTFVIDGSHVVVASFNLDPRSIEDNTELALTIHSKELAEQALQMFEESTTAEKSYQVALRHPEDDTSTALTWKTTEDGKPVTYHREPEASLWRRAKIFLYQFLPIEDLL